MRRGKILKKKIHPWKFIIVHEKQVQSRNYVACDERKCVKKFPFQFNIILSMRCETLLKIGALFEKERNGKWMPCLPFACLPHFYRPNFFTIFFLEKIYALNVISCAHSYSPMNFSSTFNDT